MGVLSKLFGGGKSVGPSEQELALKENSSRQWRDYQDRWVPVENKFMSAVQQTSGQYDRARGMATVDNARIMDKGNASLVGDNLSAGNQAGSGAMISSLAGNNDIRAGGLGKAVNTATAGVHNRDIAGKQKIVSLGRNQANTADLSMRTIAQRATNSALEAAKNKQAEREGLMQAIGVGVGMYAQHLRGKKPDWDWNTQTEYSGPASH